MHNCTETSIYTRTNKNMNIYKFHSVLVGITARSKNFECIADKSKSKTVNEEAENNKKNLKIFFIL